MTLRDQLASDMAFILSTNDFGESVTYVPKSGPSRTVVMDVVLTEQLDMFQNGKSKEKDITVTCGRDVDDETIGGVADFLNGDEIIRKGIAYRFSERVQNEDDAALVGVFTYKGPHQLGNSR